MSTDTFEGKVDQVVGKAKQGIGEAVGNQELANSGAADQVKGNAKEAWGNVKDTASDVHSDAQARTDARASETHVNAEDKAHDLREKVTSAAENLKNTITGKTDEVRERNNY